MTWAPVTWAPPLGAESIVATPGAFSCPIYVAQAPGAPDTLWVVEKTGTIRLVRGGAVLPEPFLDLRAQVGAVGTIGEERGLLGLAFHPGYATNGRLFVAFTPGPGASEPAANVVLELRRSAVDPDRAEPAEVARLLAVPDPYPNHNGGGLAFGPDGFLYVGTGDGGGSCNPTHAGQDLSSLLAKLLRLDPDAPAAGYAAAGNPFALPEGLPQIWSYGLRNPWRFSFDRETGELYVGDVGQSFWEELDIQAPGVGGQNYGWNAFEGLESSAGSLCEPDPLVGPHTPPVLVVRHFSATEVTRDACSITGGYVYRGAAIPELRGVYLFGDYCSNDLGALRWCEGAVHGPVRIAGLRTSGHGLSSFGEDLAGELYLVDHESGDVLRLVPR